MSPILVLGVGNTLMTDDGVGVRLMEHLQALQPALAGVDTAYYLVHSMAAGRNFGELDLIAAGHFADAAARAGVRRIVYLGGLMPPDAESDGLDDEHERVLTKFNGVDLKVRNGGDSRETVGILARGSYAAPSGRTVDVRALVDAAVS